MQRLPVLTMPHHGWLPEITAVQVMTHSRCNANCWFCPHAESDHNLNNPGRMTDETWKLIIANLIPFKDGIERGKFCPYLQNEPLIDKTIFEKLDDIYSAFPKTCVEISTNGAALTERVVEQLFERFAGRRHDLWVSHHGVSAETLNFIMQINYDQATENLIRLLKMSDGRFTIKIRGAGESRDGRHSQFTRDQYLDYWNRTLELHGINRENISVDAFTFHDRAGELTREERGANLLNSGTVRQIDPQHPFYCPRLDGWLHFNWDGRLVICCHDYHANVALPNINEMSLLDYFHGPEYYALVEKVSGRTACEPGFICTRCQSVGG